MDDEPYVRLVYSHAEGYGGYDDIHFFRQEHVLVFRPCLRIQSRVVWQGTYAVHIQKFRQFLHFLAAQTVYYS